MKLKEYTILAWLGFSWLQVNLLPLTMSQCFYHFQVDANDKIVFKRKLRDKYVLLFYTIAIIDYVTLSPYLEPCCRSFQFLPCINACVSLRWSLDVCQDIMLHSFPILFVTRGVSGYSKVLFYIFSYKDCIYSRAAPCCSSSNKTKCVHS